MTFSAYQNTFLGTPPYYSGKNVKSRKVAQVTKYLDNGSERFVHMFVQPLVKNLMLRIRTCNVQFVKMLKERTDNREEFTEQILNDFASKAEASFVPLVNERLAFNNAACQNCFAGGSVEREKQLARYLDDVALAIKAHVATLLQQYRETLNRLAEPVANSLKSMASEATAESQAILHDLGEMVAEARDIEESREACLDRIEMIVRLSAQIHGVDYTPAKTVPTTITTQDYVPHILQKVLASAPKNSAVRIAMLDALKRTKHNVWDLFEVKVFRD
jgi:hypothetical protein